MSDASNLVATIIDTLVRQPDRWDIDGYRCARRDDGVAIYIEGGRRGIDIFRPIGLKLSFWDRRRLWKAIRKCAIAKLSILGAESMAAYHDKKYNGKK